MIDLLLQIVALALLLGGVAFGHRRWIRPRRATLTAPALGLLGLLVLTCAGGFLGSPFWWLNTPQSFAWELPPLAARMLASAGWTFAVVCFFVLERPTPRRVRLALLMLNVYLAPLVVAVFLFHLNRFDFAAPITYGFFSLAGGIALAALWYLFRQPLIAPDETRDAAPSATPMKIWLGLVAAVMAAWGLALFITDNGPSPLIWVWPGDLLTSRLIAVMLWAIAVGAAFALTRADTARLMLGVTVTYGAGVALASAWNALAGKPIQPSYLIAFGVLGLVSAAGLAIKK
jgi:hypothetical protein